MTIKPHLNWDNRGDRKKIITSDFESEADLLIFDEIHKYKQWKKTSQLLAGFIMKEYFTSL